MVEKITEKDTDFQGYTIDELRYRRAYALAKYEMSKMRMVEQFDSAKASLAPRGLMGKIIGNLNWLDYAVIGFNIFKTLRRLRRK